MLPNKAFQLILRYHLEHRIFSSCCAAKRSGLTNSLTHQLGETALPGMSLFTYDPLFN